MNEKLELYREVVGLDPQSRVFFLYAQMLEKEQREDEALTVLARGLEYQPDYIEARLYYIDLLARCDKFESAKIQLQKLTSLFQKYPGFWATWSKLIADEDETLSSLLALLSSLFTKPSLSLIQIFKAGIQQLTPENPHVALKQEEETSSYNEENSHDLLTPFCENLAEEVNAVEIKEEKSFLAEDFLHDDFKISLSGEIKTSTHTRSMADLLAEQGDMQGAIEIYFELLEKAEGKEKDELVKRIDALMSVQKQDHMEAAPVEEAVKHKKENTKNISPRMQAMLEKLALRLEDRATM